MIEHEHLVAQHREAIEIVGALLVRDRHERRLQACDVRLEHDRDPVAEPPLHARADDAQEPGGGSRRAESDRRPEHEILPVVDDAVAEQQQPERDQRIGQRRELRQNERPRHQPRLVAVAQLAQPPHRRQRRRKRRQASTFIRLPFIVLRRVEPLRLQIEHRPVAAALRHQLVVRAELDDAAVLEDADAIGVTDGREAMRDEDRRAAARRGKDAIENLRFAAHVELRGRLVEQHDARAELNGAQRARERHALPLAARELGSAVVAARQDRVERRQSRRAGGLERLRDGRVVRAARRRARCRAAATRTG